MTERRVRTDPVAWVPSERTLYRRCSPGHHHHLVCRTCRRTVEVTSPAVQRWISAVAAEHGFHDIEHRLELIGICPDCARSRPTAGEPPP